MKDVIYKTRPFMSGKSQVIRIPKEYRIEDDEVVIKRVGESLVITPQKALQKICLTKE